MLCDEPDADFSGMTASTPEAASIVQFVVALVLIVQRGGPEQRRAFLPTDRLTHGKDDRHPNDEPNQVLERDVAMGRRSVARTDVSGSVIAQLLGRRRPSEHPCKGDGGLPAAVRKRIRSV